MPITNVRALSTTDGKLFATRDEAIAHEIRSQLPRRFQHPTLGTIDFVADNWQALIKFLEEINAVATLPDPRGQQPGQERDCPAAEQQ